ncbi:MAG: dipeptide epimerase [Proteobacteria bacterium]|nr:dipeptide epimerase [Pseudomonadota bacterium]
MRIRRVESWKQSLPLTRPYTIATREISSVELFFVKLVAQEGLVGYGSASPAEHVTGESELACGSALAPERLEWLEGRDARRLGALSREAETRLRSAPAARACLDMALYDLFARSVDVPLVEFLGRQYSALPTSITIGIKSTEAALDEAQEYVGRGFRHLKVKIGLDLNADIERVRRLHERFGNSVAIRVDANQGYTREQTLCFSEAVAGLGVELLEQPLEAAALEEMRTLPASLRRSIAADESLHDERDAVRVAAPPAAFGIFNIKLMKCGGIRSGLGIATIAEASGRELMWGCMDESVISIAAALHAALSAPATRYLDLDGSFDLGHDMAEGGFCVEQGTLRTTDRPGLGVWGRS